MKIENWAEFIAVKGGWATVIFIVLFMLWWALIGQPRDARRMLLEARAEHMDYVVHHEVHDEAYIFPEDEYRAMLPPVPIGGDTSEYRLEFGSCEVRDADTSCGPGPFPWLVMRPLYEGTCRAEGR